jgi:peroxiredoxin Q/BCP
VSADAPAAQEKFKQKYNLPFPLLCDVDRTAVKAYDVLKEKNLYGKMVLGIERTTFLIDSSGNIQQIFSKVKVDGHTDEVLRALKNN